MPIENTSCECLSLIMLDSFVRVNKRYYPQILLKECKYEMKKTKMENIIINDLESSSSDSETKSVSDNEPDHEANNEFDNK